MTVRPAPPAIRFVDREAWTVDLIETTDEPHAMRAAWEELESIVGSLRGQRMIAAVDVARGRCRVCVRASPEAPARVGTVRGEVAGGRFARVRLLADPPALYAQIGPAFERLAKACTVDPDRDSIEDYRRHDTVDCLLPVRDDVLSD